MTATNMLAGIPALESVLPELTELSPNLEIRVKGKVYWLVDWQEKTIATPYKKFSYDRVSQFLAHYELLQTTTREVLPC